MTVSSMKSSQGLCHAVGREAGRPWLQSYTGAGRQSGGRKGREGRVGCSNMAAAASACGGRAGEEGYHKRSAGASQGSGPEGLLADWGRRPSYGVQREHTGSVFVV